MKLPFPNLGIPRSFWRLRASRLRMPKGKRSGLILAYGLGLILLWQIPFCVNPDMLDTEWQNLAATGMTNHYAEFFYFFYHTGVFPMTTIKYHDGCGEEEAKLLIDNNHRSWLRTEYGKTIRYGDLGKIFLFFPDIWMKTLSAYFMDTNMIYAKPGIRTAHALFFIFSLWALFFSCWLIRQPILGGLLILALGGHPFQLYETYVNENVFSLPQTVMLLMLALHLPLIALPWRGKKILPWLLPLLAGIILGTARQVRIEPCLVIAALIAIYAAVQGLRIKSRLILIALLLVSFMATSQLWGEYFKSKLKEADSVVAEAGGIPYRGPQNKNHHIWHTIWCGLGDFDQTHGYEWCDRSAFLYALPRLVTFYQPKIPEGAVFDGWEYVNLEWIDGELHLPPPGQSPIYVVEPSQFEHYSSVVRDKVLLDISEDPLWFAGILTKRTWRVLNECAPVRIGLNDSWLSIPFPGWLAMIAILFLALQKACFLLKIVLFSLTLSILPITVFSGLGTCYYECYTHMMFAILCALAVELVLRLKPWRRTIKIKPTAVAAGGNHD